MWQSMLDLAASQRSGQGYELPHPSCVCSLQEASVQPAVQLAFSIAKMFPIKSCLQCRGVARV